MIIHELYIHKPNYTREQIRARLEQYAVIKREDPADKVFLMILDYNLKEAEKEY